jgi:hypothetical protein
MHPGWADTPGLAIALPGFHRVMGPILRSPQQGADTVVWLATADTGRLGSGQFWHDRRPRSEYLLPWTRESSPAIAGQLWERIAGLSGLDDPQSLGSSPPATEQLTRPRAAHAPVSGWAGCRISSAGAAVVVAADYDDGAGCVMDAVLAHRAEQRFGESAVPAAPDHEQVGAG